MQSSKRRTRWVWYDTVWYGMVWMIGIGIDVCVLKVGVWKHLRRSAVDWWGSDGGIEESLLDG